MYTYMYVVYIIKSFSCSTTRQMICNTTQVCYMGHLYGELHLITRIVFIDMRLKSNRCDIANMLLYNYNHNHYTFLGNAMTIYLSTLPSQQ